MSPTERLKKGGEWLQKMIPFATVVVVSVVAVIAYFLQAELANVKRLGDTVTELRLFQAETKGNRHTSGDALVQQQFNDQVHQDLSHSIDAVSSRLPSQFPPEETTRALDRMLIGISTIEDITTKNQVSIGRLEVEVNSIKTRLE